jgi:hypothetical protein
MFNFLSIWSVSFTHPIIFIVQKETWTTNFILTTGIGVKKAISKFPSFTT